MFAPQQIVGQLSTKDLWALPFIGWTKIIYHREGQQSLHAAVSEEHTHMMCWQKCWQMCIRSRDGDRLVFIRYRTITDTFKTIPVPKRCRNRYFFFFKAQSDD